MEDQKISEEEILKCYYNVGHFINTYCKIEKVGKGLGQFKLYKYQEQALYTYLHNDYVVNLKSRQMGFTTLAAAYSLWRVYSQGESVLLLSKREEDAMDILRKIRIMYENLPNQLQLGTVSMSSTTIEFANKNRIQSLPATERSGAGKSSSLIFLDEFSAFPSAKDKVAGEDVWNAILPTISVGGKVIVQSTPKGMGNKFYQLWAGENNFKKYKYSWIEHPEYSKGLYEKDDRYGKYGSPWADKMQKNMSTDGWAQEFGCDFLQSGRPVFDIRYLIKKEIEKEDLSPMFHYACGVDLASGSGADWHVAQFINVETGALVETYRSQEPIDVFAKCVELKCCGYNNALLCFENNSGYGIAFMKAIEYTNLYYQTRMDKRRMVKTRKAGWNTNSRTKPLMVSDLNIAIENSKIKLTDDKTIDELRTFQYYDDDKMGAMAGHHDDCVMSLAIAWQAARSVAVTDDDDVFMEKISMGTKSPTVSFFDTVEIEEELFAGLVFGKDKSDWRTKY